MMDDVWGNAWSQSDENASESSKGKLDTINTSWSFPSTNKHEEADIGLPSWSTGEVKWAEPSGEASLWSSSVSASDNLTVASIDWGSTSPGFKIYSADEPSKFPTGNEQQESRSSTPAAPSDSSEEHDTVQQESPAEAFIPVTSVQAESAAVNAKYKDINEPQDDEDLKTGVDALVTLPPTQSFEDTELSWSTPVVGEFSNINGEDAWGSAWGSSEKEEASVEELEDDEWALAQEAKLRRDRSVPPELLAAMYDRLDELSKELFPKNDDEQDYQRFGNWRNGLASVEGMEDLMQRYTPHLSPQPPIQFSKSHVAKAMANSVKLTKNLPLARNSPMAHLFMTKSLAAWELSVKNRVEERHDVMPPGWRIEAEAKVEDKPALVEKKSGGLLSFFSRRASTVPSSAGSTASRRSSSLSREAISAGLAQMSGTDSSRNDVESSLKSPSITSPPPETPEGKLPQSPVSSAGVQPNSAESAPPPTTQDSIVDPDTPPAPSVVSRFFNRFSRTTSDIRSSSSSPRSSLALSTNDLEFLSDIVPSHTDDADEDDQLAALSAMVSSPPISSKLSAPLPPPLAPPPLAPPPQVPQSRPQSRTSLSQTPHLPMQNGLRASSLLANFEDLQTVSSTKSNLAQLPTLPPLLPAPLAPSPVIGLSKPPTSANAQNTFRPGSSLANTPPLSPRPASPALVPSKLPGLSIVTEANSTSRISVPLPASAVTPISALQRQGPTVSLLNSPDPPPPIEKSPNRVFTQTSVDTQSSASTFDDDDFSDFQSPTTTSSVSQPFTRVHQERSLAFGDASYEVPSNRSFLSNHSNTEDSLFGDFGDFVAPVTQSSQPIAQPSSVTKPLHPSLSRSSSSATIPPPPPKKRVPAEIKTSHIRKPSSAEREAAAQLVERAAAHKGRWPAPLTPLPSPLPAPLPAPSGSSKIVGVPGPDQLLLDLDDPINLTTTTPAPEPAPTALKPISQITANVRSSLVTSTPAITPPTVRAVQSDASSMPSLLDLGAPFSSNGTSTPSRLPSDHTYALNGAKVQSTSVLQKGGLSAQDLSFFEGL